MAIIFYDGFETLPFTGLVHVPPWTGVIVGTNDTVIVEATDPKCGTYNMLAYRDNIVSHNAYVYKHFNPISEVWGRVFFKKTVGTASWQEVLVFNNQANGTIANLRIAGVNGWRLYYLSGGATLTANVNHAVDFTNYICVELHVKIHGATGEYQVWVDGVLIYNLVGLDTDDRGNVDYLRIGDAGNAGTPSYTRFDDVVVADQRIFCECYAPFGGGCNPSQMAKVILGL